MLPFSPLLPSFLLSILLVFPWTASADVSRGDGTNCSCGFYDASTDNLFTESLIVYFNESTSLPIDGFKVDDFEHSSEKDWNSIYRQGATPSNVVLNQSALNLYVSPPNPLHMVDGAGIKTLRHDIQYGSFRTYMRSPGKSAGGGSSLSMFLKYNDPQSVEVALMNTDDVGAAWVGNFMNGEFPTYASGTNYTILGNGSSEIGIGSPWDFVEYRIDWTKHGVNYSIGTNITRHILRKKKRDMFSVPSPFEIKHWSTGNKFSMQGPPSRRSLASVGWIRLFFNSSTMSAEDHTAFDNRCSLPDTCSMDDVTLRGSSPFTDDSLKQWKQKDPRSAVRIPAIIIASLCIFWTSLLLLRAFIIQEPWKKWGGKKQKKAEEEDHHQTVQQSETQQQAMPYDNTPPESGLTTPSWSRPTSPENKISKHGISSPSSSVSEPYLVQKPSSSWDSNDPTPVASRIQSPFSSQAATPYVGNSRPSSAGTSIPYTFDGASSQDKHTSLTDDGKGKNPVSYTASVTSTKATEPPPVRVLGPRRRVEYLAGTVALCAVVVTVMHFSLTYVPALVIPGAPYHYESEVWARRIVSPIFLNQMWLGVFFTTSTRFLVDKYLRDGELAHIAQTTIRRTPRLMIPVTCATLIEYFLVDCGVTSNLERVPSISWSSWPYVSRYPSFGIYLSELMELYFVIPNQVPQITFNYCTGVLWTIAVQLQFSWICLLGVIMVREIRNPWKRFGFYAFCIITNWYAQSWGSYFWVGLLLADLDITYNYNKWLETHVKSYYLILFSFIGMVILGFAASVIPNWLNYNFSIHETDIHPDMETGRPLAQTIRAGYPPYYVPRLNGFFFAVGLQAIVELSPFVQKVLSSKYLTFIFPHIFTIYLLHGLVFWSWGSWLCVFLQSHSLPYWLNSLLVAITSYIVLILSLPIMTPIMEILGRDLTNQLWAAASEKPPPRRPTLFPFPRDLFATSVEGGNGNDVAEQVEQESEKEQMKEKEKEKSWVSVTRESKVSF